MSTELSSLPGGGVEYFNAPGFSQAFATAGNLNNAVRVPGNASIIHITGQLGLADDGTLISDPEAQLRKAFKNVEQNLLAAGASKGWKSVYKCVAYHSPDLSMERLGIYAKLIKEFCGENRPSQTSIAVAALWQNAYIEIAVEAVQC